MNKDSNFDVFKNHENYYEIRLNITGDYMCETDTKEKAEAIVKALEKQIPMKPYDISKIYTGEKVGHCECGYSHDVLEHEEYCHYCGQKLDWK